MLQPRGDTETYAALLRKHNGGVLNRKEFEVAVVALQTEVVQSTDFGMLSISDQAIFASVEIIHRHNLNSTDAAILTMLLEYSHTTGTSCLLIAADQRLLRAAAAEGMATLNPETVSAAEVTAILTAL